MTMPIDLLIVRHGESELNVAGKRSKKGDNRDFTPAFLARHSSSMRLTDRGREQARTARDWVRANVPLPFDRHYTSEYVRAMETAALLELPNAEWFTEFYLRERDWGALDVMPDDKRRVRYADDIRRMHIEPLYWTPPRGESIANLCQRAPDRMFDTLHRECGEKRVAIVCHGEVMWSFRVRLERMSARRYRELDASTDPKDHIHNCQILWFTRRNPEINELSDHLDWMKSVCPTDLTKSRNVWEPITRPRFSNADLLAEVARTPQIIK